jgi:hypothetical protein
MTNSGRARGETDLGRGGFSTFSDGLSVFPEEVRSGLGEPSFLSFSSFTWLLLRRGTMRLPESEWMSEVDGDFSATVVAVVAAVVVVFPVDEESESPRAIAIRGDRRLEFSRSLSRSLARGDEFGDGEFDDDGWDGDSSRNER